MNEIAEAFTEVGRSIDEALTPAIIAFAPFAENKKGGRDMTNQKTLLSRVLGWEGVKWLIVYWVVVLSVRLTMLLFNVR